MNTIQVQLNERQLKDLIHLVDEGLDAVETRLNNGEYLENPDDVPRLSGEGIEAIHDAIANRTYLWTSGCGHLELEIPAQAVDDIARPGDNEPAVKAWLEGEETNYLRAQVERIDHNDIRTYLTEAGIDEVREKSVAECRSYLLWMACHDIAEERNQED